MRTGRTGRDDRSSRSALRNSGLVACTLAAFTNNVIEWAMYIVALVYAFDQGGANTAGFASIAMLLPVCFAAPLAGVAAERHSPARLLLLAYAVEAVALTAAAATALADAPLAITILGCAVAQGGISFTRPVTALLTPALVRSARELTVANVWSSSADSASMLAGPVVATVLLAVSGAAGALAGCAVLGVVGSMLTIATARREPAPTHESKPPAVGAVTTIRTSLREIRRRPGAIGVLGAVGGGYVLIGALDLLLVVFAQEDLGMAESGPGVLTTSIGVGAVISSLVSSRLVQRRRLAPLIIAGVAAVAAATAVLASVSVVAIAMILLPIVGFSRALVNLTTRMLLQRSAPPGTLAPMFAVVELLSGVGMLLGSIGAQGLIALRGAPAALFGLSGFFVLVLVLTWRPLRHADDGADVPVVAISLLRRLPLFAPLPPLAIEAVARSAVETPVAAGADVVIEGDAGDHFYAIADGTFEIVQHGDHVRTIGRGNGFGEVALLADVPRTATVTARTPGSLLAIGRAPFLEAVTGCDSSQRIAWTALEALGVATPDQQISDG